MVYSSLFPVFIGFFLGLIVGSFLNVCIYRIPKEESIIFPGSHCPHCNHLIKWYDNIPVLSYIFLKGRCRYCGKKISPIYPMVEILTGIFTALLFFKFKLSFDAFYYSILTWFLIAISFIDIKELQVPVKPCYFTMVFGMAFSIFTKTNTFIDSILGASLGAGIILFIIETYYIIKGKEGMGYGDANILATIGAFLGWKKVFFVIMLASMVGAVVGILISIKEKKHGDTPIPFGPFLSIGGYLTIFVGNLLLKFYLGV
ncbi:prepilin peptidase [Desulfurobacterium atlanticum]|uniref:Prepilin leader peptidase/N-methyltransferase n=1 Tax=Desulfurobacterium atlanticum TaxID=240169 RepID=A0A238Y7Q9_9BACT|nr:A24 family peptidase [Desulfurobacterium atlanticum]SNR66868.1 leader peptidase (prepilin peptidase) / N-methyltransferase [Desulfurobacterium atlanticum]